MEGGRRKRRREWCSCETESCSRVAAVGSQGGDHQIAKAAQDEASPSALRRKTPEAQGLLLAEREGVLRWILPEAHGAGSAILAMALHRLQQQMEISPKAPRTKPTAAFGLSPPLAQNSMSLASIGSTSPSFELWSFWSRSRATARCCLGFLPRAFQQVFFPVVWCTCTGLTDVKASPRVKDLASHCVRTKIKRPLATSGP